MPLTNQGDFGRYFGAGFELCYTVHPKRMDACQLGWSSVWYGVNVKGLSITDAANATINTDQATNLNTYYNKNINYLLNNGKSTYQASTNTTSTPISRAALYGNMDDYYAVICRLANIFLNTDSMNRNIIGTGPNTGNMRVQDYEMVRKPLIRLYGAAAANRASPDLSYVINLQDITELSIALAIIIQNYTNSAYNSALYPANINQDANTFWSAQLATGTTVEDNTKAYGFKAAAEFIQMLCNGNSGTSIGSLSILYNSNYPTQSGTDYQLYRKMLTSIGSSADSSTTSSIFGKIALLNTLSNANKDLVAGILNMLGSTADDMADPTIFGKLDATISMGNSNRDSINANISVLRSIMGTNNSNDNSTVLGALYLLQSNINLLIGAVQQLANIQGVPVNLGVQGFLSSFNPTSWLLLLVLGIILILQLRVVLK